MSRKQSPMQKKAFKIWCESGRTIKPAAIAEQLEVKPELIRKWKSYYEWDSQPDPRPGAPRGNRNAKSNKGGTGGPEKNDHAVKHGLFRRFMPDDIDTLEIYDTTEELSPLELLWTSIRIAFTNIIRSQKIQFVKDKKDITKVLKKKKPGQFGTEQEWEFQQPWDKQDTALTSQAAAMTNLTRMIKQYEDMLRAIPPDQLLEEHSLRLSKLKAEVKVLGEGGGGERVQIIDDIKRGEGK